MLMGFLLALCPPFVCADRHHGNRDGFAVCTIESGQCYWHFICQLGQKLNFFIFLALVFWLLAVYKKKKGKAWSIYKVRVSSSLPTSSLPSSKYGKTLHHEGRNKAISQRWSSLMDSLSFSGCTLTSFKRSSNVIDGKKGEGRVHLQKCV